jgi:hypothetical protein
MAMFRHPILGGFSKAAQAANHYLEMRVSGRRSPKMTKNAILDLRTVARV